MAPYISHTALPPWCDPPSRTGALVSPPPQPSTASSPPLQGWSIIIETFCFCVTVFDWRRTKGCLSACSRVLLGLGSYLHVIINMHTHAYSNACVCVINPSCFCSSVTVTTFNTLKLLWFISDQCSDSSFSFFFFWQLNFCQNCPDMQMIWETICKWWDVSLLTRLSCQTSRHGTFINLLLSPTHTQWVSVCVVECVSVCVCLYVCVSKCVCVCCHPNMSTDSRWAAGYSCRVQLQGGNWRTQPMGWLKCIYFPYCHICIETGRPWNC